MNDLSEHVTEFLSDCRARGHSPYTVRAYSFAFSKYVAWARTQGVSDITQVTRPHLRAWAEQCSKELSPGGAHARLRPLRTFFLWLEREDVISANPMSRVALPRLVRKHQPDVDAKAVRKLLQAAVSGSRCPLRDAALVALMFDTGLRASEVAGIQLAHVHAARIEVHNAKGGKFRSVPVSRAALTYVRRYVQKERPETTVRELFVSPGGEAIRGPTLGKMLDRLSERAKLPHVSPHMLRRGFAVELLRGGGDVFSLQRIMGHSTLEMSNRYAQLLDDDLEGVHRAASPLRRALR